MESSSRKIRQQLEGLDLQIERLWALGDGQRLASQPNPANRPK